MRSAKKDGSKNITLSPRQRFLAGYKSYGDYYLLLICLVGACICAAVGIALFFNVLLGLGVGVLCAVVWTVCTSDERKKQLGIVSSHVAGKVHIKSATAAYGEELFIPERLEYARVTAICDCAFSNECNCVLKAVYIPSSITYIGKDIFGERQDLPEIHFDGTRTEWKKIECHTDLSAATLVFSNSHPLPKRQKGSRRKPQPANDGGEKK